MGFFSDLKEDLSMAVNELVPGSSSEENADNMEVDSTVDNQEAEVNPDDIADLLANLTGTTVVKDEEEQTEYEGMSDEELLNAAFAEAGISTISDSETSSNSVVEEPIVEENYTEEAVIEEAPIEDAAIEEPQIEETQIEEFASSEPIMEESTLTEAASENVQSVDIPMEEVNDISIGNIDEVVPEVQNEVEDTLLEERNNTMIESHFAENESATDEKSMITEGMTINGDVISKGSLEVLGTITGNLDILGKLDVSGSINGNSRASEIYAENAKIVGEVVSLGSVKIGQSTVIIGNVTATSAVIAGAIKGDIDVKGPVILDTSAIVMGNIKSKSVQINNGAVIEGLCSQCYADVNPSAFFDEFKRTVKA